MAQNNLRIGYWPKELFNHSGDDAAVVRYGGTTSASTETGLSPQMGTGSLPNRDYTTRVGFFIRNKILGSDFVMNDILSTKMAKNVDSSAACYDLGYYGFVSTDVRETFSYGGPGGASCDLPSRSKTKCLFPQFGVVLSMESSQEDEMALQEALGSLSLEAKVEEASRIADHVLVGKLLSSCPFRWFTVAEEDKEMVFKKRSWSISGAHFILKEWPEDLSPREKGEERADVGLEVFSTFKDEIQDIDSNLALISKLKGISIASTSDGSIQTHTVSTQERMEMEGIHKIGDGRGRGKQEIEEGFEGCLDLRRWFIGLKAAIE
ncbi:hypothetical protein FNV43_RR21447 [Rhamnella rubrinervis]|uniref:Neprosin PEP catalytic domain-containing protein n=1 Tax=Rhamnella rubrinervis TaxID=2594499 RepID=A0A8K0E0R3_9ROSA|nr:hypothetical protein FNV43_RR21447 [Rhamnella rubrinervis]